MTDLSSSFQDQKPIRTVEGISQAATQIRIPAQTKRISVGSRDAALFLSLSGADGITPDGSDCAFIIANNYLQMDLAHHIDDFYISTIDDTTTTITVILE